MIKIFNIFTVICCCAEVFSRIQTYPMDIISVENSKDFQVIDSKDNSEKDRFQASVYRKPEKCIDGSLRFSIKVNFRKFKEPIRFNGKIIENSRNGQIFDVVIPKDDLKNEIFYKNIRLESDDPNYRLDNIRIKVELAAEISADRKQVSFGKISYYGGRLVSEISPSVTIRYFVLKDAVCEITSQHNFRLVNKNHYIPYSMNGLTENRDIVLPSDRREYVANFRIEDTGRIPASGIYSDKITFSIKTQL